jgi:hypothetical protein
MLYGLAFLGGGLIGALSLIILSPAIPTRGFYQRTHEEMQLRKLR